MIVRRLLAAAIWIILPLISFAQNQNAFSFDGLDDYISVPNASALIAGSTAISITCWVSPDNTAITWPDYDGFLGFRNDNDADFYLVQLGPQGVEGRFKNSAGTAFTTNYTGLIPSVWQHFALVYDGSSLKMFHNGQVVSDIPASGTITNASVSFLMGNLVYSITNFYLLGELDEVSLWNVALTDAQVQSIYSCAIDPISPGLLLYYKFDQGVAGANNAGITTLLPTTGSLTGVINNAALSGTTSNWVAGIYTPVNMISATICQGESYLFGTQVLTSPGQYNQVFSTPSGCDSVVQLTLSVTTLNTSVTLMGITLTSQLAGATYQWLDCGNAYAVIPGATAVFYIPVANGSYAVRLGKNGCVDTSACVPVTTVGIAGETPSLRIHYYPNPATDVLYVTGDETCEYQILDVYGRKLSDLPSGTQPVTRIDVSGFEPGMYFLKVSGPAGVGVYPWVKK